MVEVSATDFVKNFGQYKEQVQREVIAITTHGRTSCYFISEHEYMFLKAHTRQAYPVSELPKETIDGVAKAQMDASHDHLNAIEESSNRTPQEAAAHIRELRKGNFLPNGVTIYDLINEGRA